MGVLADFVKTGAPGTYAWTIRMRDDVSLPLKLRDATGTVIADLSTVTGLCQIRADYTSVAVLTTPTVAISGDTVTLTLTTAQTAALAAGIPESTPATLRNVAIGVFDLQLTDADDTVTVLSGTVTLSRDVSESP